MEQPKYSTLDWRLEVDKVGLISRKSFLNALLQARKVKGPFNVHKI